MRRALLASLSLFAACASFPLAGVEPRPGPNEGEWGKVRPRFSRGHKVHDGLGTNAIVNAVYLAPVLRAAKVERVALWKAMTPREKDAAMAAELAEAEKYDDFLVAFFTTSRPDNDLDTGNSVWRVALILPGVEVLPEKIDRTRADSTMRTLYPEFTSFDTVYRVRFARRDPPLMDVPFRLLLAGAKGKMALDFSKR